MSYSRPSLMIIVSVSQFHVYLPWVNACLAMCISGVINVKVLVGAFNQETKVRVQLWWGGGWKVEDTTEAGVSVTGTRGAGRQSLLAQEDANRSAR